MSSDILKLRALFMNDEHAMATAFDEFSDRINSATDCIMLEEMLDDVGTYLTDTNTSVQLKNAILNNLQRADWKQIYQAACIHDAIDYLSDYNMFTEEKGLPIIPVSTNCLNPIVMYKVDTIFDCGDDEEIAKAIRFIVDQYHLWSGKLRFDPDTAVYEVITDTRLNIRWIHVTDDDENDVMISLIHPERINVQDNTAVMSVLFADSMVQAMSLYYDMEDSDTVTSIRSLCAYAYGLQAKDYEDDYELLLSYYICGMEDMVSFDDDDDFGYDDLDEDDEDEDDDDDEDDLDDDEIDDVLTDIHAEAHESM